MGKLNIKKMVVFFMVFSSGFFSAFYIQKFNYEKSLVEADTWLIYNPLSSTMVKLLDEAKSCRPNPDIDIWYRMIEFGAQDLYDWHRDRVKNIDLVDTEDYIESHRRAYKHEMHYVEYIKKTYNDCKFTPLEEESD